VKSEKRLQKHHVVTIDLVMFLFTCELAWFLKWSATDLVWCLWISSLVVGYSTILGWIIEIPSGMLKEGDSQVSRKWVFITAPLAMLFSLVFFTIHFGGFHFGHSIFLSFFFPPWPLDSGRSDPFSYWPELVPRLLLTYWPFVLATGISTWSGILHRNVKLGPDSAYKNVIRMHVMIFVFAFLKGVHVGNYFIYVLTLAVFFFPWPKK
jgi:hypothetical protein